MRVGGYINYLQVNTELRDLDPPRPENFVVELRDARGADARSNGRAIFTFTRNAVSSEVHRNWYTMLLTANASAVEMTQSGKRRDMSFPPRLVLCN